MKIFKKSALSLCVQASIVASVAGISTSVLAADEVAKAKVVGVEVIEVTGVRSSLEDALNIKRNASSIVDAISAKDMDSLPALNLGEALQAVPGIQLNREGERRESSVNLRGLPSGFVNTTVNGQSISGASRSDKTLGAPNPFGAYDAQIFNGVRVIKSATADMVEGGISGTIDQKLLRALSSPEQSLKINLGARYEELNDTKDPEFAINGSKHFDDGKLAVVGTLAYSKQSFRRDTIKINRCAISSCCTKCIHQHWLGHRKTNKNS